MTTKELKKKHSSRQVGGTETGSRSGKDSQPGNSWRTGLGKVVADQAVPRSCADKPGGTTGHHNRPCNPGFQCGKKSLKTSD